jgi:hypothetical protein
MFKFLLASSLCFADDISLSETSYNGAQILEGDNEVLLDLVYDSHGDVSTAPYAYFEGNTLYAGNSDVYGNSVDAIIEFFWFESSIDRGSDFYVAVIKARSNPGNNCYAAPWVNGYDCHLWADEIQDWGEHPALSVEALKNSGNPNGAFRWDWSVPFENYGIDAYGQVLFSNQYGIGGNTEGSAMAHGEYQINEEGDVQASGDIQVKGYVGSEYRVQTQYEVTLYEWDVDVTGRADIMAWDMYLNTGVRDDQSAYHEYFLAIQVEEGNTFEILRLNIVGNFDLGWWNPLHYDLGISMGNLQIMPPPDYEEPVVTEPSSEPAVEPAEEPVDTGLGVDEDTAITVSEPEEGTEELPQLENDMSEPVKGCNTASSVTTCKAGWFSLLLISILLWLRARCDD